MKISLIMPNERVPRAIFYDLFCHAVKRNHRYVPSAADADLVFPAEDACPETNWPRYGNQPSAFMRGQLDQRIYLEYVEALATHPGPLCVLNMVPQARLPLTYRARPNIIVADISLAAFERAINPRTISFAAPPVIRGTGVAGHKTILASFRGVASHQCRHDLAALHNGTSFICELVDPANHSGRIDAQAGTVDARYVELLQQSAFAFVPRGDALFSYRLIEVLSFGCIPIILSDGWVLPFDRQIPWAEAALIVPERHVRQIPQILMEFPQRRIIDMLHGVRDCYQRHFSTLEAVIETLLREIELAWPMAAAPV